MNENKLTFEETGRFAMIPQSFIKDARNMKIHSRWLYVALVFYRNSQSGVAFPSYKRIRELTGLRREKISAGIKELVERGWIEKTSRYSQSNIYKILFKNDKILDNERGSIATANFPNDKGEVDPDTIPQAP
jgi:DNA replication protein DnaD